LNVTFNDPPTLTELALSGKIVDVVKYEKLDLLHVHYAIPHASAAYMAREILESGQELGLHGYNHISLTEHKTKVNVAVWPSQSAMERSLERARQEWISMFGEHTLPYAYIAPNNIIAPNNLLGSGLSPLL